MLFIGQYICALGRLCGLCDDDYGVTLDLQACTASDRCAGGLVLFIILCMSL